MQLTFEFLKEEVLRWEDLDDAARTEFLERLARMIAKAAFPDQGMEGNDDD